VFAVMAVVLVGTDAGVTVLDGGTHVELEGRPVGFLTRDRSIWWALADGRTIWRRAPDGAWSEVATIDDVTPTCLQPLPGGALVGTAGGHLLRALDGTVTPVAGFDAVEGRDTWHAVGSPAPYVRSVTVTADSRALLANVHVGGIPCSRNGGATWKPTIAVDTDVHEVRADVSDPRLVVAAAAVGLAESHDAGATWNIVTDGLHATYCRAVTLTSTHVLVSASDGPFATRGAIYTRPLDPESPNAGSLVRCAAGLPEWTAGNVDTGCLDAHRDDVAFGDREGTVFASHDGGASWTTLAGGLGSIRAIGVGPSGAT
jgi:hypothetical protein